MSGGITSDRAEEKSRRFPMGAKAGQGSRVRIGKGECSGFEYKFEYKMAMDSRETVDEVFQNGLKPDQARIDKDKCIGGQMCFSDDLTKLHRHQETGKIFREYAGRYYDGSKRPLEDKVPKKFQLELIGTESDDRVDRKICPRNTIPMDEFDERDELSKNFSEPAKIDAVNGVYVMDAAEKQRLEEKQLKLHAGGE